MLNAYGENGFTFSLFHHLCSSKKLVQPFLENLKRFKDGKLFASRYKRAITSAALKQEPDVWLFPNFGKSSGFGEPDALVLWNGFSFWIEVETEFNLKDRRSAAEKAILQLLRFHYLSQALSVEYQKRDDGGPHRAIVGPTISGKGIPRLGVLRVASHAVLQKVRKQLSESIRDKKDQYVLFADRKMKGISLKDDEKEPKKIQSLLHECAEDAHRKVKGFAKNLPQLRCQPASPCEDNFWYAYYEGDLKGRDRVEINTESIRYVPRKTN